MRSLHIRVWVGLWVLLANHILGGGEGTLDAYDQRGHQALVWKEFGAEEMTSCGHLSGCPTSLPATCHGFGWILSWCQGVEHLSLVLRYTPCVMHTGEADRATCQMPLLQFRSADLPVSDSSAQSSDFCSREYSARDPQSGHERS